MGGGGGCDNAARYFCWSFVAIYRATQRNAVDDHRSPRQRPLRQIAYLRKHDLENVDDIDAVVPLVDHGLGVETRHVEVSPLVITQTGHEEACVCGLWGATGRGDS